MFKNLDPQDIKVKPFKTFKNFTFTNDDSGSGVFLIKARSGSYKQYVSSSDAVTHIISGSVTSSFYALPTWNMINKTFYKDNDKPFRTFGNNSNNNRELNVSASVISVAREIIGEEIKPGSIELTTTIDSKTYTIKDDKDGNLYDNNYSASFAAFKSSSFDRTQGVSTTAATRGSGSEVGNIFYEQGLLVFTDTGSYKDVGFGTGYTLKYKATQTHYQYEYQVRVKPHEFNSTTNISITPGRSGSITMAEGVVSMSNYFPPSDQPSGAGTGSYATFYNAATESIGIVTESTFRPFVTDIGLYSENNELLAHGKLAKPIKLSDDIETSFIVRFDV